TRRAQDLVDPPQLGVLPRQPPVLLDHVSAWPVVALAAVGLVLADPVAQGFRVHVQLLAQPPKRRARGRLPIQPHRALAQLIGVLLRCCQQCLPSWLSRSNQSWKTPEKRGNLINLLKQFRAVATRYDKLAVRYEATTHIAAIDIWLRPLARNFLNSS